MQYSHQLLTFLAILCIETVNAMDLLSPEQKIVYNYFKSQPKLHNKVYRNLSKEDKVLLDYSDSIADQEPLIEQFIRSYYEKGIETGKFIGMNESVLKQKIKQMTDIYMIFYKNNAYEYQIYMDYSVATKEQLKEVITKISSKAIDPLRVKYDLYKNLIDSGCYATSPLLPTLQKELQSVKKLVDVNQKRLEYWANHLNNLK